MSKKVFCGGLPWESTDEDLREAMSEFGTVTDCKIIMDRETGRSKGFGFVTFSSEDEAENAISSGGIVMVGRKVRIDQANDKRR